MGNHDLSAIAVFPTEKEILVMEMMFCIFLKVLYQALDLSSFQIPLSMLMLSLCGQTCCTSSQTQHRQSSG